MEKDFKANYIMDFRLTNRLLRSLALLLITTVGFGLPLPPAPTLETVQSSLNCQLYAQKMSQFLATPACKNRINCLKNASFFAFSASTEAQHQRLNTRLSAYYDAALSPNGTARGLDPACALVGAFAQQPSVELVVLNNLKQAYGLALSEQLITPRVAKTYGVVGPRALCDRSSFNHCHVVASVDPQYEPHRTFG